MERLTERVNGKLKIKDKFPTIGDLVDVLASKVEIYEDAEEQKQLIVLPCKVGDTLYCIDKNGNKILEKKVAFFNIAERVVIHFSSSVCMSVDKIGNHAFLTREEAEKALIG